MSIYWILLGWLSVFDQQTGLFRRKMKLKSAKSAPYSDTSKEPPYKILARLVERYKVRA
jgi:hypothetical protein